MSESEFSIICYSPALPVKWSDTVVVGYLMYRKNPIWGIYSNPNESDHLVVTQLFDLKARPYEGPSYIYPTQTKEVVVHSIRKAVDFLRSIVAVEFSQECTEAVV